MADSKYRKILFVCRGSTCRSPTAEAILRHLLQEREDGNEWEIDGAGTHVVREGLPSNERGLQVLKKHGIASNHRARQVNEDDFRRFDVIITSLHYGWPLMRAMYEVLMKLLSQMTALRDYTFS